MRLIRIKARKLANLNSFIDADVEDVEQDLAIHVWRQWPRFDPAKSQPSTFARRLIDKKAANLLRHQATEKRRRCSVLSLDEAVPDKNGRPTTRASRVPVDAHRFRHRRNGLRAQDRADLTLDVLSTVSRLPEPLQIVCAKLGSLSITHVAREFGIPRTTFYDNVVAPLRRHFADAGLTDYLT